ncbi:MAG: hypothetical protein ACK4VO_01465 [Pseudobdellovibrio sp.]
MMRLIVVTAGTLFISFVVFMTVKMWGRSQTFIDYNRAFYKTESTPLLFKVASSKQEEFAKQLQEFDNLYLNVATTLDQRLILVKTNLAAQASYRSKSYDQVATEVIELVKFKDELQNKKLIFNMTENAIAGHEIFIGELQKLGLDKSENIVVTSPYDVMAKSVKELRPTLLYATSQPEILRIKAMESMNLIEAVSFRADILIHPRTYYKQIFFTDDLLTELKRRHVRIIVGPDSQEELEKAKSLNPFALIEM